MNQKVLAVGNALVDIITQVSEEKLQESPFAKGSMTLVEWKAISKYIKELESISQSPGGSASNTICALAELGVSSTFVCKLGKDDLGLFYQTNMKNMGVTPQIAHSEKPTGVCCSMVTPDKERTMITYLGASIDLSEDDVKEDYFKGANYLYVEGYLIDNKELIEKCFSFAKKNNMKICLDLGSYNVVRENISFLRKMMKEYVDVVFSNEDEALAYTGKKPREAVLEMAKETEICVVKTGPEGSLISTGDQIIAVPPQPARVIDTTGAGDLYAAGFLFGLCKNMDLSDCGRIGTLLASSVVEELGAKLSNEVWASIKNQL